MNVAARVLLVLGAKLFKLGTKPDTGLVVMGLIVPEYGNSKTRHWHCGANVSLLSEQHSQASASLRQASRIGRRL